MYVAMLLTDWWVLSSLCIIPSLTAVVYRNVISKNPVNELAVTDSDVYIGRSETAMWMRVVSSWVCILLYTWSLLAPVFMPDRCGFSLSELECSLYGLF